MRKKMRIKILGDDNEKPIKIGLLAGFIASLCCIGPLVLVVLGVGGASTALAIGKQSPYFLTLGVLILVAGLGLHYFRKNKKCNECDAERLSWKKMIVIIILACTAFIAVYYILLYVLVPWLAPIVYQNFYN